MSRTVVGLIVALATLAGALVLRRRRWAAEREASRALRRDLADVLELLAAGIDGGSAPWRVVAVIAPYLDAPLGPLLGRAAHAAAGDPAAPYGVLAAPALRPFVATLRAADQLGTPLADDLRALAADERDRQIRDVRLRAAAAGPRMTLVIGGVLAPAALLLVVGSEVLSVLDVLRTLR